MNYQLLSTAPANKIPVIFLHLSLVWSINNMDLSFLLFPSAKPPGHLREVGVEGVPGAMPGQNRHSV